MHMHKYAQHTSIFAVIISSRPNSKKKKKKNYSCFLAGFSNATFQIKAMYMQKDNSCQRGIGLI